MICPTCGKELNIKDLMFVDGGVEVLIGSFYQCESCGFYMNELLDERETGTIN